MVKVIAALVLALLFVLPAGAQDISDTDDAFCHRLIAFSFPNEWVVEYRRVPIRPYGAEVEAANSSAALERGDSVVRPGEIQIGIHAFENTFLQPDADTLSANTIGEITQEFTDRVWVDEILAPETTAYDVEEFTLDGYAAASRIITTDEIDRGIILVDWESTHVGGVTFVTATNEAKDFLPILQNIAASIEYPPTYLADSICAGARSTYVDSAGHFSFNYPRNWTGSIVPIYFGRVLIANTPTPISETFQENEVAIRVDVRGGGTVRVFGNGSPLSAAEVAEVELFTYETEIEAFEINGNPAARAGYSGVNSNISIFILYGNGIIAEIQLTTAQGESEMWYPLALEVAESLVLTPDPEQCTGEWPYDCN
jgi:hypothetical protein